MSRRCRCIRILLGLSCPIEGARGGRGASPFPPTLIDPSDDAVLTRLVEHRDQAAQPPQRYILGRRYGESVMDVLPSRVFMSGNSQAVRIPAEFRLSSDRVQIRRTPEGDLIIHPCPAQRGQALLEVLQGFSDDFVLALEQQKRDSLPIQDRQPL